MKLRTSFFNISVLRKNLTRFAPLWSLYSVAELLGLFSIYQENASRMAEDINQIIGAVGVFHMVYALLVAACLFGDLFDSRMCNGLHAMPMRREGWLLTNLVSGLVFALIPAAVGSIVGGILLKEYFWVALVWQGVSLLQFVFFFGLALFSAMCAGKKLSMVAIYAIFNFLSLLLHLVASEIYEPLLHGIVIDQSPFTLFCPAATFAEDCYMDISLVFTTAETILQYGGFLSSSWHYLWSCAAVGIVLTVLAWLLYRCRHLESAGDFISFRPMGYFFLLVYTLSMGLLLYGFTSLFGTAMDYSFLAVGLIIGYFTGWMLLERTTKIFNKKVFAIFGAFAVVFAGSIGLTLLDPLGLETRVPGTEEIESVCMYHLYNSYYYDNDTTGWYIDDPAQVEEIRQLHQQMIQAPEAQSGTSLTIEVRYQLKNGLRLRRKYEISANSQLADQLEPFFSDVRSVFSTEDWEQVKATVEEVRIYNWETDGIDLMLNDAQSQALLTALEQDCAAGLMAQHEYYHIGQEYLISIEIYWSAKSIDGYPTVLRSEHISVYEDSIYIKAFLEELLQTQTH